MSECWIRDNQTIQENLGDDEIEKFVMRTLAPQYDNDSSDDKPKQKGGSQHGRRANRMHLVEMYDGLLFKVYFLQKPIFDDMDFRCAYRMRRPLFLRILEVVTDTNHCFIQNMRVAGKLGLCSLKKATNFMWDIFEIPRRTH